MSDFTHYEILGVSPDADAAAIKAAYRAASKAVHPDASGASAALFAQVAESYRVLSEPSARHLYDVQLRTGAVRETDTARSPSPAPAAGEGGGSADGAPLAAAPERAGLSRWWLAGAAFIAVGVVVSIVGAMSADAAVVRFGMAGAAAVALAALVVLVVPVALPPAEGRVARVSRSPQVRVAAWAAGLLVAAVVAGPLLAAVAVAAAFVVVLLAVVAVAFAVMSSGGS